MNRTVTGLIKPTIVLTLALAGLAAANADEITVVGGTMGRFDVQAFAATGNLLGLSYSNSTFDNTTVGGFLGLGGNPSPGSNFNNLGSFTLSGSHNDYTGHTFDLEVTFTAPATISGGGDAVFHADLVGSVSSNHKGGVFINFDNAPQTFTFSNPSATGSFEFWVNDVSIAPGQAASVTGNILGAQQAVPEPASLGVIGLGVVGLLSRRRIKAI